MIFPVDTLVNFSGPRAVDQALAFCDDCPVGSAVLVADGTQVRMLRSVVGEFRLAEKSEIRAWGRGDAVRKQGAGSAGPGSSPFRVLAPCSLLLAFLLGSPSGAAAADTMVGTIGSAPAAFLAEAATALPDPKGYEALGWLIAGLAAIVVIIGGIFAAIIGGLTLIEKIRGTSKVQATTKRSDDGPGRVEFDLHITNLRDDMIELKTGQQTLIAKLEDFGGAQYKARGRMHRKMNRMENAMFFWVGKMAGEGDPDAKRLQAILEEKDEEDTER